MILRNENSDLQWKMKESRNSSEGTIETILGNEQIVYICNIHWVLKKMEIDSDNSDSH